MKNIAILLAALSLATGSLALAAGQSHDNAHDSMHGDMHAQVQPAIPADGVIKEIDQGAGKLVIEHGPIDQLKWPTMVMDFRLQDPALTEGLQVGDTVHFQLVPGERGAYLISDIEVVE